MKKLPPQPRRKPSQARSKLLVDAIVQSCHKILMEEGVQHLTTNRIAEVAGVTIGSLYQYFPNKEAILANLFTDTIAAETDQISRLSTERILAQTKVSLRSTLRELIAVNAELHLRFLNIHGDFYREYHRVFDFRAEVDARNITVYHQPSWEAWLPELLNQYHDEIKVTNVEQAAFIIGAMIDRLLEAALEDRPDWLDDIEYLAQIESAVMHFLTADK